MSMQQACPAIQVAVETGLLQSLSIMPVSSSEAPGSTIISATAGAVAASGVLNVR